MFKRVAIIGLCLTFGLGYAVAEERPCPSGAVGAWTWTANALGIKVENPELEFEWATINKPVTGKGLTVRLTVDYTSGEPSLASYEASAPTLVVGEKGEQGGTLLFAKFEADGVYPPYPREHRYTLNLYDGQTKQPLTAGRLETWSTGGMDDRVSGVWVQDQVAATGLDLLRRDGAFLVAALIHYVDGAEKNSAVAQSGLIDLSEARQAWDAALQARAADAAVAKATNTSCKRP